MKMTGNEKPTLLVAMTKDGDWISEMFRNDYHVLPAAADALELLSACLRQPVSVLIADRELPMMQGTDLIEYIRKEHLADCVILAVDERKNAVARDELYSVDGVLKRPLSKSSVYSCVTVAEANCRRNRQIIQEYDQLDQEFRQKRALNYAYLLLQQAYNLTQKQASERLLRIAGGNSADAADLAQKLFEIYLIKGTDNDRDKQKKRTDSR